MSEMKDIMLQIKRYQQVEKIMTGHTHEDMAKFLEILKSCEKLSLSEFKEKVASQESKSSRRPTSTFDGMRVATLVYKTRQNQPLSVEEENELDDLVHAKEWHTIKNLVQQPLEEVVQQLRLSKPSTFTLNQLKWISKALLNIELQAKKKDECKTQLIDILNKKLLNEQLKKAIK